ncbi:hypothetical protein Rhe02_01660 [Rhizocola hellebori]|uniref:DUF998 domain-containing protein n=1 Tax=Rhizocola hellebori TaxID=1392758 RepID=A0A8J3Q1V5_9ACTN|nr:DUF998 domain-containing protein [Rhizocola hellebori]GIH02099.1 hypothetical protein Rhe02_01660 [Rhizocola hellebori]
MATVSQDTTTVRRLRLGVGVMGMALPVVITIGYALQVGEAVLLNSISGAYYTDMRDVFVGSLCAIGVFLICYRYARPDNVLSTVAGIAAIAVALFPTTPKGEQILVSAADDTTGIVHGVAAIILFLDLAAFCFFLFPRSTAPSALTMRKKTRNVIYTISGIAILVGLGLAALGSRILPDDVVRTIRPLWWGESVAIFAFGIAWFTKSNTIFRDRES